MSWEVGDDDWLAPPTRAAARAPVDELDARLVTALTGAAPELQPPVSADPEPAGSSVAEPLTSDALPPPPHSAAFDASDEAPPSYESGSFVADEDEELDPAAASGEYASPREADDEEPDFHIPALSLSAASEDSEAQPLAGDEPSVPPPGEHGEPATISDSVYDDEDEQAVIPGLVAEAGGQHAPADPRLEVELEPVASPLGYHAEATPEPAAVVEPQFVIPTLARPEDDATAPASGDEDELRIPSSLLSSEPEPEPEPRLAEVEGDEAEELQEVDGEAIESLDAADLEELEHGAEIEEVEEIEPVAAQPVAPPAETKPPAPPEAPRRRKAWFDDVFAEHFLFLSPPTWEQTCERDAQFIHTLLGEREGLSILDVGCGDGRHAVELAKLGGRVTGLDNSLAMLLAAAQTREAAELEDGRVDFIHGDMRRLPRDREYDAVVCIGTTLGYFEEEQNWHCLQEMCERVAPGGRLLIHVFNRDFVAPHLPSRSWWQGKRCMVIDEAEMNFFANRLRVHRTVIFDDGRQFEHYMFMRAYTVQDLGKAISQLGMRVLEVSGSRDTRGRFYGSASPDIWIVAEKK